MRPTSAAAAALSRQLVDTGVDVDLHALAADGSLGDADNVIQPAVALVVRLEPADQVLPSRLVAFEDRAPTKLEQDGCAIVGRDEPAHVRFHGLRRSRCLSSLSYAVTIAYPGASTRASSS